jgi:hypothetical protein
MLLYVPLDRARTQHALIEAEAAGVIMEPRGSPWQHNTRLKVLSSYSPPFPNFEIICCI